MSELTLALAITLGTSRVTAATATIVQSDEDVAMAPPAFTFVMPSVAFIDDDGQVLVGSDAQARAPLHPERVIREFSRRIGDDVAIAVAGRYVSAESVSALVVRSVIDEAARHGHAPVALTLTHPLTWTRHRLDRFDAALAAHGIHDVGYIAEPIAAASQHARHHDFRRGDRIAVFDLGGTTFDATVLRYEGSGGFSVVGNALHVDDLGGVDFDDLLLGHVLATADADIARMADDSASSREALAQLRLDVVRAKETLSSAADARIPVPFSSGDASVRITRAEFEVMIGERLERAIEAFERALDAAGSGTDDLTAILLVGGSSRIPLVAQRLSERFDQLLAVADDPALTTPLGAAGWAAATAALTASRAEASQPESALTLLTHGTGVGEGLIVASEGFRRPGQNRTMRASFPLAIVTASGLLAGAMVLGSTTAAGNRGDDLANTLGPFIVPTQSVVENLTPTPSVVESPRVDSEPAPVAQTAPAPRPAPRDVLAERDPRRPTAPTRNTPPPPPRAPKAQPTSTTAGSPSPSPSSVPSPANSATPPPAAPSTPPTSSPEPTPTDPQPSTPPSTPAPSTPPPAPAPEPDPEPSTPPPPPPDPEPSTPPPPPPPDPSPTSDPAPLQDSPSPDPT